LKTRKAKSSAVRGLLVVVVLVLPLAGCALPWGGGDDGGAPATRPTEGGDAPPTRFVAFGGNVSDARDGSPLAGASVRLDLAQVRPCRLVGVVWASTDAVTGPAGRWGPVEVPVPRSDDVAFFVRVSAPGYSEDVTFMGPQEARGDTRNLTAILHPEASVDGTAEPGTVVALEWPGFPRLVAAAPDGRFAFPNARVTPMQMAADTTPPWTATVAAPATAAVPAPPGTAWRVEGVVRRESGAPAPADVVAPDGTRLVGAARAAESGVLALPLDASPAEVRIEARTPDGRYGGAKLLDLNGPPAQRETVLLRPLC
jgi:hypothetical protein